MIDAVCDTTVLIDLVRSHRNTRRESAATVIAGVKRRLTTSITIGELWVGLAAAPEADVSRRKLLTILPDFDTLNFDVRAAREYGKLVASLRKQGAVIGVADAMIAAIALANGAALITRNLRHFNRIPHLRLITY